MRRWARAGASVLVLSLALSLVPSTAQAHTRTPEQRVRYWVNVYRSNHIRPTLARSWPLDRIAEHHSRQMAGNYRLFGCAGPDVVAGARVGHLYVDTIIAWQHSTYRKVLLNRNRTRIGVGVVKSNGIMWTTVVFR